MSTDDAEASLLFVTNEGLAHEEDLGRASEAFVPHHGAVNCQAATAPTESMLPQHTDSVPHDLAEAKREHFLTRSARHQCGLPRLRSAQSRRPRQLPHVNHTTVHRDPKLLK